MKSSEDEEDDESSSEENKLSDELSTSSEKLQQRKLQTALSLSQTGVCNHDPYVAVSPH